MSPIMRWNRPDGNGLPPTGLCPPAVASVMFGFLVILGWPLTELSSRSDASPAKPVVTCV